MKIFRYLLFALLCYIVFLLATLPAKPAYAYLKEWGGAPAQQVVLKGITGSVWSGNAAAAVIQGNQFKKLHWQFHPLKLFMGRVSLSWEFKVVDGYGKGQTDVSYNGSIYLHDIKAWLPVEPLAELAEMSALKPQGAFVVDMQEMVVADNLITSATGSVSWRDAEVSLLKTMPLGNISIDLQNVEEGVKGIAADKGGPLAIDGILMLTADGKYDFNGSLSVRDPQQTDLKQALQAMGRPGPDGKIPLKRSGDLASLKLM